MPIHREFTGGHVDKIGWVQETDPLSGSEAGLVVADRCWAKRSSTVTEPVELYLRNATNTTWQPIGPAISEGGARMKVINDGTYLKLLLSADGVNWKEVVRTPV